MKETCARKRPFAAGVLVVVVGTVLAGVVPGAQPSVDLKVTRGTVTLKRAEQATAMTAPSAAVALRAGDVLAAKEESAALVLLGGKGALELAQESSAALRGLDYSEEDRTVTVTVALATGAVRVLPYRMPKPEKEPAPEEPAVRCDLRAQVGGSTIPCGAFAGQIALHAKGRYTIRASAGAAIVQLGRILMKLKSAIAINEGPPLTVTADPKNETPVLVGCVGAAVLALRPGQSVAIEVLEDRVRVTNLSATEPLYGCRWEGLPFELGPGEVMEFEIIEEEVEMSRALAHMERMRTVLSGAFPEVFPPEVAAPPEAALLERVESGGPVSREDQGGLVSPFQ